MQCKSFCMSVCSCVHLYIYMFVCVCRYCHVVNCRFQSASVPLLLSQRSAISRLWCPTCVSTRTRDARTRQRWLRGHCVMHTSLLNQQKLPNNRHLPTVCSALLPHVACDILFGALMLVTGRASHQWKELHISCPQMFSLWTSTGRKFRELSAKPDSVTVFLFFRFRLHD